MNLAMNLGRLTWKEYRIQRNLWISVIVLTVVSQVMATLITQLSAAESIPNVVHAIFPFLGLAIYLLGCGATLFAVEHEWGTFDFQRLLPVTAWQVYATKVGLAFSSALLLLATLVVFAHTIYIGWQPVLSAADWLAGLVTGVEIFVWAVLFSLLLRNPMRAALCGIAAASIWVCVILPAIQGISPSHVEFDLLLYHRSFLAWRLCLMGIVLAADTALAYGWFHGRIGLPSRTRRWRPATTNYWIIPDATLPTYSPHPASGWERLVYVTWRQGRSVLLLFLVLFLWAALASLVGDTNMQRTKLESFTVPLTILSAIAFGLCAFTFDQSANQFRFYAERGVGPRKLWLARQAFWVTPIVVQAAIVVVLFWPHRRGHHVDDWFIRGAILLVTVTIYAISQLAAMLIRSTLVALVVSVFASALYAMWLALTRSQYVPVWLVLLPLPVIFFVGTWYFVNDWIEERSTRRHWLRVSGVLGIPLLAILIGYATFRAVEIPEVQPGYSVDEYTRPLTSSEQETLKLYRAAIMHLGAVGQPGVGSGQAQLAQWQPVLDLLEEAHDRVPAPVTLASTAEMNEALPSPLFLDPIYLVQLLRSRAANLTELGKLSEAWRQYEIAFELLSRYRWRAVPSQIRWADQEESQLLDAIIQWSVHPKQTKDQLAVVLAKLRSLENRQREQHHLVTAEHFLWSTFLSGEEFDPSRLGLREPEARVIGRFLTFLPWERIRHQRLLDLVTRVSLDRATHDSYIGKWNETIDRWRETTVLSHRFGVLSLNHPPTRNLRVARIIVALIDWRREHGELPDSLDALVGPYFAERPVDPLTGRPFYYTATGFPGDLRSSVSPEQLPYVDLDKGTPFLWSSHGASFPRIPPAESLDLDDFVARREGLVSDLNSGRIWKIPPESAAP